MHWGQGPAGPAGPHTSSRQPPRLSVKAGAQGALPRRSPHCWDCHLAGRPGPATELTSGGLCRMNLLSIIGRLSPAGCICTRHPSLSSCDQVHPAWLEPPLSGLPPGRVSQASNRGGGRLDVSCGGTGWQQAAACCVDPQMHLYLPPSSVAWLQSQPATSHPPLLGLLPGRLPRQATEVIGGRLSEGIAGGNGQLSPAGCTCTCCPFLSWYARIPASLHPPLLGLPPGRAAWASDRCDGRHSRRVLLLHVVGWLSPAGCICTCHPPRFNPSSMSPCPAGACILGAATWQGASGERPRRWAAGCGVWGHWMAAGGGLLRKPAYAVATHSVARLQKPACHIASSICGAATWQAAWASDRGVGRPPIRRSSWAAVNGCLAQAAVAPAARFCRGTRASLPRCNPHCRGCYLAGCPGVRQRRLWARKSLPVGHEHQSCCCWVQQYLVT